jgi:hypothetical protein
MAGLASLSSLGLATEKDPARRRVLDDACCCLLEAAAIALFCIALARLERRKGAAAASQPISARARVARQGSRRDDTTLPDDASCWRLGFLGLGFGSCSQQERKDISLLDTNAAPPCSTSSERERERWLVTKLTELADSEALPPSPVMDSGPKWM